MTTVFAPPTGAPAPITDLVAVGDIFYNSWGYDQTNIDFYKVVRKTRCKVEVVPIGARLEGHDGGSQDILLPDPTTVREYDVILGINQGDERRSRLCKVVTGYRGQVAIVLESGHHWADRWAGDLKYQTDVHSGH